MSQRTRTVQWCEGRILEVLSKAKSTNLPTSLALCSMAMKFEIRNLTEQQNFDIALYSLIRKGVVVQDHDEKGFEVLRLAA